MCLELRRIIFLMYAPCILYNLLSRSTKALYIYIYSAYKQYFMYRKYSNMFRCICIIFKKSYKSIKTPEDEADASKF